MQLLWTYVWQEWDVVQPLSSVLGHVCMRDGKHTWTLG